MLFDAAGDRNPPMPIVLLENPGIPRRGFPFDHARLRRRRPRGARRSSARRADRPHCGRRASPQAPLRRGARAYAAAIRRRPAASCIHWALGERWRLAPTIAEIDLQRRTRRWRRQSGLWGPNSLLAGENTGNFRYYVASATT